MRILALEPFYGGSHRAFLDGWIQHSRHDWTLLTLPDRRWKWRMRHAGITFSEQVKPRIDAGASWDLVVCSDMLDLAGFKGLAGSAVGSLPAVVYFHENQLTYPVRVHHERDYHFGMTNLTTCVAADRVWFNSAFHKDSYLQALEELVQRMTEYRPTQAIEKVAGKSEVMVPGIDPLPGRPPRRPGPLRIVWAARWEHDKGPDTFFEALLHLKASGTDFRVSVLGEQYKEAPPVFAQAHEALSSHVDRWGFQESKEDYRASLGEADVVVSTALHEFFGISVLEAVEAGAYPLVPERLAYPEVLQRDTYPEFFYDGSARALALRLQALSGGIEKGHLLEEPVRQDLTRRFHWPERAAVMDQACEALEA